MDARGWDHATGATADPGTASAGAAGPGGPAEGGSSLVQWRRRGAATELRVAEPVGDRFWRRGLVPPRAIPAASAATWWAVAGAGHIGVTSGVALAVAATGAEILPIVVTGLVGLIAAPVSGVIGYFTGKRRQREALARAEAIDEIATASTVSIGTDVHGITGKALLQKTAEVLRGGRPQTARVLTNDGYVDYRIEPIDATTVSIEPVDETPEVGLINRFVRPFVQRPITAPRASAETDARVAGLEARLRTIDRVARIDASHPSYPAFTTLQIDRMTEYRRLAAHADAIARVDTPEARETTAHLTDDLDAMVELMATGVDELERAVFDDLRRASDTQLHFLREKYAPPTQPDAAGPSPESGR